MMKSIFAVCCLTFCLAFTAFAEDIRYCERISDEAGQWRYPDENAYYREMTIRAERTAVETLFGPALETFRSTVIDRGSLIDALTNFVEYDRETVRGDAEKDFCVILKNPRKKAVSNLFSPVEIGRACHFDAELLETQIDDMRKTFISDLRNKDAISGAVLSMMEDPTNINMKTDAQLARFIYEKTPEAPAGGISETECRGLYVFPIELYTASSKREISSIISVMPAIETHDEKKRKGEFQLVVIEKEYHWIRGSEEKISNVGNIENFTTPFENESFRDFVAANFRDMICIGMASCEGETAEENRRGQIRSENLIRRLSDAFASDSPIAIYGLNLGKHRLTRRQCHELSDTARDAQRIVMLVGVTKRSDPDVDVVVALRKAMKQMADSKQDLLPINPEDYHLFELLEK